VSNEFRFPLQNVRHDVPFQYDMLVTTDNK